MPIEYFKWKILNHIMNADLHSHSLVSDGTLSPGQVAARAQQNGVQLWSLTDHDGIAGQLEAKEAALAHGMSYLTGVEISVTFAGQTVHIVGLGFDLDNEQLQQGLAQTRAGRAKRAKAMAHALEKKGIMGVYEGAVALAGNPDLISRAHLARYMVQIGVCQNTQEVFRRYLVEGKPGFVPHQWARLEDCVRWICQAGGMAVIAHPARYAFTANQEDALFSEFKRHGGLGVEVVTGSHHPSEYGIYADKAKAFGFYASRGSDFHSPHESPVDLGMLENLRSDLTPVWEALAHRVIRA